MHIGISLTDFLLRRDPEFRPSWVPTGADFHVIISRNLDLLQTSGWMKSKANRWLLHMDGVIYSMLLFDLTRQPEELDQIMYAR